MGHCREIEKRSDYRVMDPRIFPATTIIHVLALHDISANPAATTPALDAHAPT